jgi:DNA-binding MarR family transcriptional regulator
MSQAKLRELLKVDIESYNILRALQIFMNLDKTQDIPIQAIAVFMFVATYKTCTKEHVEEHFGMSKSSASRMTDYLSKYHRLGKAGQGLIYKERDENDKRKTSLRLSRKGKDLVEKICASVYEDTRDEIGNEE